MLGFVFLFVLTFGSSLGVLGDVPGESDKKLECFNQPNVTGSGDIYRKCFNETVKSGKRTCKLDATFTDYIKTVNTTCKKPAQFRKTEIYLDIVRFALSNDLLDGFLKNTTCIEKLKPQIIECVNSSIAESAFTGVYETLWKAANLNWNLDACYKYNQIKGCVVQLLNNCTKPVVEYAKSLFQFANRECPQENNGTNPPKMMTSRPANNEGSTIVIVVLCLVLLQIVYVLYRDFKLRKMPCFAGSAGRQPDTHQLVTLNCRS